MHVLVFGGTSSMGLRALPLLHEAGHTLVAYVRSPSKIPDVAKAWVEIIEGTLEEGDKVRALFQREQAFDAILSFLGPSSRLWPPHPADQPISRFYALLYLALQEAHAAAPEDAAHKVPRLLALGTLSQHNDAKDHFSITARAAETAIRIGAPTAYSDVKRWDHEIMNGATAAGAEYTIFRVGVLLNRGSSSPAVVAKAGYIGDGLIGVSLDREDAAVWLVQELAERQWVNKLMAISS